MMASTSLFCLACLFGVSFSMKSWDLPTTDLFEFVTAELSNEWELFKKAYNKTYSNEMEIKRRLYWEDTIRFIRDHNLKYDRGEVTFTVGENEFADMAEDEFEETYLRGLIVPEDEEKNYNETLADPNLNVPLSKDWRKDGLVSVVKNQGQCGSCWAFSALAALEGQQKKLKGDLPDLAEQQLVDCADRRYGNWGCRGGWMNNAFRYIADNQGVDGETCYPYTARDGSCKFQRNCVKSNDRKSQDVPKSEDGLKNALGSVGPMAIAMDVNHRSFWYYKRGIFTEPRCSRTRPNHAMAAVGYGTYRGTDYYIVKNSWGKGWGASGYVFTIRNGGNNCGIYNFASYPVL